MFMTNFAIGLSHAFSNILDTIYLMLVRRITRRIFQMHKFNEHLLTTSTLNGFQNINLYYRYTYAQRNVNFVDYLANNDASIMKWNLICMHMI